MHQGPSDKHDYAHAHHWAQAAAAAVHTNTILRPNRHHEPFRAVTTQLPRPVPRTAVAFGARPRWTTATVLGWAHAEGHHACGGVGGAPLPSHPLFPPHCPTDFHSSQPSHTVLATNPHTLPHHALQTLHTAVHIRDNKGGKGWVGGFVDGSATTMRHRFPRQTHAHNFRGVVCIHIQSPKHLESMVEFPHHQA